MSRKKPGFRFHCLGIPHTSTDIRYTACAFTMKVLKFMKMMKEANEDSEYEPHYIIHYGNEDSDRTWCDEHVTVTSRALLHKTYGDAYLKNQFKYDCNDECYKTFYANGVEEMRKRLRPGDIVLAFWGSGVRRITDHFQAFEREYILCEPGIGYPVSNIYAPYCVYESYAYLNFCMGARKNHEGHQGITQPPWTDVVIPNYFDPADFDYTPQKKKPYFLFIGRLNWDKGLTLYLQLCQLLGFELIIGGQGRLEDQGHPIPPNVKFVGYCDREMRRKLMAEATCAFLCSFYVEPFGGTAVEAMMSGTPVITTDNGVFNETVIHGVTGYRVRDFDHAVWACRNIHKIDPAACRQWALMNYSLQRVRLMYEEYFDVITHKTAERHWNFYTRYDDRKALSWLHRYYPPQVLSLYNRDKHDIPSAMTIKPTFPPLVPLVPAPAPPPTASPGAATQLNASSSSEVEELKQKLAQLMLRCKEKDDQLAALQRKQEKKQGDNESYVWPAITEQGMWPVTVVTALYDTGRGSSTDGDGRTFEWYLENFAKTLTLNVPMVVFVDPAQADFVKQHRAGMPTHLICEPFSKAPCFNRLSQIAQVLKSPDWRPHIQLPGNLENRLPTYNVVIWSKFGWMKRAITMNTFRSRLFFWLDAAINRFFGPTMNPRLAWPHSSWIAPASNLPGHKLKKYLNNNKIWIEGHASAQAIMNKTRKWDENRAIGSSECILPAGCFGGTAQAVEQLEQKMMKLLDEEFLGKTRMDNEQVGLSVLWQRSPDFFCPLIKTPESSTWLEIVRTLALHKNRSQIMSR